MKCDVCNSTKNHIEKVHCKYVVKGTLIEFKSNRRICDECKTPIYDEELESKIAKMAIERYNSIYGIDKDKIIELRKKIGLSQENFSKIIGCAKKTLISYEKGTSIPNDIYLIVLKMITSDPETLLFLLKYNEDRFDKKEYEIYTNKISKYLSNNKKNLKEDNKFIPTIFNGYTKPNYNKIKSLILLLCKEGIYKTKLLKELFYCDFLNYKEYGYSITGLEYARLPFGPVPDDYENIIYSLIEKNKLENITEINDNIEKNTLKSILQNPQDLLEISAVETFTKNELEIINKVIEKFKNYSVKEIEEYSHQEKAWQETKTGQIISYEYSFEIDLS